MSRTRRPGRREPAGRLALVSALTVAALAVAGCSSGGDAGGSQAEGGGDADTAGVAEDARPDADAGRAVASAGASVQRRAVVATGTLRIVEDDLGAAQRTVERLTARYGGFVADRQAVNDDDGQTTSATLRVRVPAGRFETVVRALQDQTTVVDVVTRSKDVTTEVIDVDARIRTQEVSLRRLRGFLGRTDDVSELVRVEGEIARREASLRSLRAQQAYLSDQTTLATLTVHMSVPEPAAGGEHPLTAGFGAGVAAGWRGMVTAFAVAATALGAALPFLVVLVVVGGPAWLLLRRRRPPSPATPNGGPGSAPV